MLSLKDAAPLLGLTVHGLRKIVDRSRRAHRGETVRGPTIKFYQPTKGACIRFDPAWIDEFKTQCTVGPEEKAAFTRGRKSKHGFLL